MSGSKFNRRDFFKKSFKRALPMIGVLITPTLPLFASESNSGDYCTGSSCTGLCLGSCTGNCKGECKGGCKGDCTGACSVQCASACGQACASGCGQVCGGGCVAGCQSGASLYVKMTAPWGVKDSVLMDALVVVRVGAQAHVVATAATDAVAAAMVRLVYSNGEY